MKLSLALSAVTLPLLVLPMLAIWFAASWAGIGRRYAFMRRS